VLPASGAVRVNLRDRQRADDRVGKQWAQGRCLPIRPPGGFRHLPQMSRRTPVIRIYLDIHDLADMH
jgi:hypothetical protein